MYTFQSQCEAKAVIVIVHGASEHHGRYNWLIDRWNAHGFHVVTGDLPGQGKTQGRRGHIQSFADYMETVESWVNEAVTFQLPVILLGHSMGGLVVIRLLMEKSLPVKAVILSSPCLGLVKDPPNVVEALAKVLNIILPAIRFRSNVEPGIGTRNQERKAEDAKDPLYVRKVSARWYRELRRAMETAHQEADKFPDKPLLVLQAGDDHIVDAQDVESWFHQIHLSDKSYKKWEGLYHEVFNEPEREDVFQFALSFASRYVQPL